MRAWLTPETLPTNTVCRQIAIPDDIALVAAVSGALLELTRSQNWELFGAQTPEDTALAMLTMLEQFWGSECVGQQPVTEVDTFQHIENQGVQGGTVVTSVPNEIPFTGGFGDNPMNVQLVTNKFIVAPGRYFVTMTHQLFLGNTASQYKTFLALASDAAQVAIFGVQGRTPNDTTNMVLHGHLNVENETEFKFYVRPAVGRSNDGFGIAANVAGWFEYYGQCSFLRLGDF